MFKRAVGSCARVRVLPVGHLASTALAGALLAGAPPVAAGAVAGSAVSGSASAAAARVRGPTRAEAWTARVVAPLSGFDRVGGTRVVARLGAFTRWAGAPTRLLVLAAAHDADGELWVRVRLPRRPNDAAAWIRTNRVVLSRTRWRVEVDVSERTVTVLRAGRVRHRFRAVVGAPATPTPRGRFAVAEIVRQPDPDGFLGAWALHLTAHSDVLDNYGGGPGTVAIHGRGGASFLDPLGSARSHGCVRISNAQVRYLARNLVPGTPVTIRS
jgi:lipoprotein-anchoring transpeptidase ErfK/SrfK